MSIKISADCNKCSTSTEVDSVEAYKEWTIAHECGKPEQVSAPVALRALARQFERSACDEFPEEAAEYAARSARAYAAELEAK